MPIMNRSEQKIRLQREALFINESSPCTNRGFSEFNVKHPDNPNPDVDNVDFRMYDDADKTPINPKDIKNARILFSFSYEDNSEEPFFRSYVLFNDLEN